MHIDGSYGEGGGQILRNAVAISVLTKKPIEITNIRANRLNPGIKPQHYAAIKIIRKLCNAEISGLNIGSSSLTFSPGEITGGEYDFDIGTSGSIILVFQACMLCSLKTKTPIIIRVIGGTDVKWSPSWDYFKHVFLPIMEKMGLQLSSHLIRRGYYPKGGGEVVLTINPLKEIQPLQIDKKREFTTVEGIINIANLPEHISERMKRTAIKTLFKKNLQASLKIEKTTSLSAGTGMTMWVQKCNAILGATVLGEKGLPAEKIGENVAAELIREIESGATLDTHVFDQIIPYMTLSRDNEQSSCIVREISSHAQTNMWLIRQFFDNKDIFHIENKEKFKMIRVKGVEYL